MILNSLRRHNNRNLQPLKAMAANSNESPLSTKSIQFDAVSSPNPTYKPGDKQESPFGTEFVSLDTSTGGNFYNLLISGVVPRPVAFVSTQSDDGILNLAPFSYFSVVCHDPPVLSIGICQKSSGMKDTLVNIEQNKEFVVNIISSWMVESANLTSGMFPPEMDEFEISGLTPIPSHTVIPPRVQESAFHMECKAINIQKLYNDSGLHTSTVVLGRVSMFHVARQLDEVNKRGSHQVKFEGFQPLGRLGGDTWCHVGPRFDISRPVVPSPESK